MGKVIMLSISFLLILFISAAVMASEPFVKADIENTINNFIKGVDIRDAKSLEKILDKNASIVTINKIINKSASLKYDDFLDQIKHGEVGGWKRNFEIAQIDGNDKVASAKILTKDIKIKQTEFISLVKINEEWKIVSSISTIELNNQ